MRYAKRNSGNRGELVDPSDRKLDHQERMLDEAIEETFPASDPISVIPLDLNRT
jgi:hypothetical protein